MKRKTDELLLDIADQFERKCQIAHNEWLCEKNVSIDELEANFNLIAYIIKGYVSSNSYDKAALLAKGAMYKKS